jgi:hypothetical protein
LFVRTRRVNRGPPEAYPARRTIQFTSRNLPLGATMISHALTIVVNELNRHLASYGTVVPPNEARLGNMAEGIGAAGQNGGVPREVLILSVVNMKEEKVLKNLPNQVRNGNPVPGEAKLTNTYKNLPVYLNLQLLITATHSDYKNALLILSRGIRFFQFRNIFTQESVTPASLTENAPANPLDRLEAFRLLFDLYSPSMEEVNHLWGTLGGKQYPFVLYTLRMLDLRFTGEQPEETFIREVVTNIGVK